MKIEAYIVLHELKGQIKQKKGIQKVRLGRVISFFMR